MHEPKNTGVQRLSANQPCCGLQLNIIRFFGVVKGIGQQWAQGLFSQVNADLVRSAGLQSTLDKRSVTASQDFEHAHMRGGEFAFAHLGGEP